MTGTGPDTQMSDVRDESATHPGRDDNIIPLEAPRAPLTPAAKRALAEAEARRRSAEEQAQQRAKEVGGRDGPDPVRYGDWEKGGICWDF